MASLERAVTTFYSRIDEKVEREFTRSLVRRIADYMDQTTKDSFIVAGVGGILRRNRPNLAKDIDLAVVGLRYRGDYTDAERTELFVEEAYAFFEDLKKRPVISSYNSCLTVLLVCSR